MGSTSQQDQDSAVLWLSGRDWVEGPELYAWLAQALRLTPGQGRCDLRALRLGGRIERRIEAGRVWYRVVAT